MGEPVRIDDVARDLIRLHGLEPDVDIPVVYSGRREGEKLHEELHYPEEFLEPTAHKKIHRVRVGNEPSDQANSFLRALDQLADSIQGMNLSDAREQIFKLCKSLN